MNTTPSTAVQTLDRLVGTWQVTGGATGTVTYEWFDGGHFLTQRVELDHEGHTIRGLEMIGHLHPFGEEPSEHVRSRFYSNTGDTLDYTYEIEGDTLHIWGGEKGSPAYFEGTFTEDGNTMAGGWHYPGGGGYETTMTRVS